MKKEGKRADIYEPKKKTEGHKHPLSKTATNPIFSIFK
jgi:hypothetical protein